MTTTGSGAISLKVWLSLGMGIVTLLVLAVALGLLSQEAGQNVASPTVSIRPSPTGISSSQPTSAPSSGSTVPGSAAVAAANRACDSELPVVVGLAEGADTVAEAGDLRAAADRLDRMITELARTTDRVSSRRWDRTLRLGRVAVEQWESATAGDPDAATYEQGRRSGLDLVGMMQGELAQLGAARCAA